MFTGPWFNCLKPNDFTVFAVAMVLLMKKPFFTIVTISYNQGKFLKDTINSVLNQSFTDYEYIVHDPGSSDGSREIILSYSPFLKISFECDNGPADGLNKAFSRASGKYYLFLNSDDRLRPNAMEYLYRWINKDNFSHDVYSGGCRIINEQGDVVRRAYSDKMSLRRAAYGQSLLIQPSTVFSAKSYRIVKGFNGNNKSNWDGELFIDIALAGLPFARSMRILSDYRVHHSSITGSGALQQAHNNHSVRMYEKITKKAISSRATPLKYIYYLEKKLLNPLDTMERAIFGPVFKSG